MTQREPQTDRGAALITVLTMVAVMSALALLAFESSAMSLRRTGNQRAIEQARWYLMGAESFALSQIAQVQRGEASGDAEVADWQEREVTFPLDDGVMRVSLRDGQNCFNLNSLAESVVGAPLTASGRGMVQFARLLDLADVRSDRGGLAAALADWIDADSLPLPGGAEDSAYAGARYRVANTMLADVSELRRVAGFDETIVAQLAPIACVRPSTAPNLINPNTLREQDAAYFASVIADLGIHDARQIIRDRPRGGWESLDEFFRHPLLARIGVTEPMRAQFTLQSSYFILSARVERTEGSEESAALIRVDPSGGVVVRRLFGAAAAEQTL